MLNHTEELSETVFPAINAAQHTAWRINSRVCAVLKELVEWGQPIAGLPAANDLPMPVCPKCGQHVEPGHACFVDPEADKKAKLRAKLKAENVERKKRGDKPIDIDAEIEPNRNPYLRDWKIKASRVHKENASMQGKRLNSTIPLT